MSQTLSQRLNRIPKHPLGFLGVESGIIAVGAGDLSLLLAITHRFGGQDYGWPFLLGILGVFGLVAAVALLGILDLWAVVSLLGELRAGSGSRQRLKGRLPALTVLGLVTGVALYFLFQLSLLPMELVVGAGFIVSTALAWAYAVITAPRLSAGILLGSLLLVILMILVLWLPLRAAFSPDDLWGSSSWFANG